MPCYAHGLTLNTLAKLKTWNMNQWWWMETEVSLLVRVVTNKETNEICEACCNVFVKASSCSTPHQTGPRPNRIESVAGPTHRPRFSIAGSTQNLRRTTVRGPAQIDRGREILTPRTPKCSWGPGPGVGRPCRPAIGAATEKWWDASAITLLERNEQEMGRRRFKWGPCYWIFKRNGATKLLKE